MARTKHTHRGTCQACGARQAVEEEGRIAKHGYKVEFGTFNGVCMGAGHQPAEHDVTMTHKVIEQCRREAVRLDQHTANLEAGTTLPETIERYDPMAVRKNKWGREERGVWIEMPYAEGTDSEKRAAVQHAIIRSKRLADMNRSHAKGLEEQVLPRHGKPLYPAEDKPEPRAYAKGQRYTITYKDGGKVTVTLERAAYSYSWRSGSERLVGWIASWERGGSKGTGRYSMRELNAAVLEP